MNRYAVRYYDESGDGWTRLIEAEDLKDAIRITRSNPEIVKIQEIIQTNNPYNCADL